MRLSQTSVIWCFRHSSSDLNFCLNFFLFLQMTSRLLFVLLLSSCFLVPLLGLESNVSLLKSLPSVFCEMDRRCRAASCTSQILILFVSVSTGLLQHRTRLVLLSFGGGGCLKSHVSHYVSWTVGPFVFRAWSCRALTAIKTRTSTFTLGVVVV